MAAARIRAGGADATTLVRLATLWATDSACGSILNLVWGQFTMLLCEETTVYKQTYTPELRFSLR